jgi:hypothetical protein
MDPLTIGLGIAGIGLQAYGAFSAAGHAKEAAAISKNIAGDEQRINDQKQQQMMLESSRLQLQQFRNIQRLRSQATAAAVNQGAQFGSGLQGGIAQVSDQGTTNLLGINQNREIGSNIYNINSDISAQKMKMADVQSQMATDQAWSSLGGAMVKNAGTIGDLGQNAYGLGKSAYSLFGNSNSLSGG